MKKPEKKMGFTLDISPKVAEYLGVTNQDDLFLIMKDEQVILIPKKRDPEHIKERLEKGKKITKQLIQDYAPVLKKLAKT